MRNVAATGFWAKRRMTAASSGNLRQLRDFAASAEGTAAVEFALIMPTFFALVVGTLSACVLLYSNVSLQYAVERGARCYSVNSSQCGGASATQTYAQSQYYGIGAPTFTASTPACGHQVAASITLQVEAVVTNFGLPLNATACFP
jgi:Flp pilus assembly protein TadG